MLSSPAYMTGVAGLKTKIIESFGFKWKTTKALAIITPADDETDLTL